MGVKIVVSVVSIILVVGVVIGTVALVHHRNKSSNKDGEKDESLSSSSKMVNMLCTSASNKDACIKSLGSVAQNDSATPQDYVKSGVKMAVEQITKASNLTDTLLPKATQTKYAEMTNSVISNCKDLFDLAKDRLDEAMEKVHDFKNLKDEDLVWSIRLWLTDVVTFATSCVDEFGEAEAPDLQKSMQDGISSATDLTTTILDIITVFNKALTGLTVNMNATKLVEDAKSNFKSITGGRRLLGMPVDDDGYPTWLSAADRKLLGSTPKKGTKTKKDASKKKGTKTKKAAGAAAAAGAGAAVTTVTAGTKPNAVVALDGSGQYKSIMAALAAHPGKKITGRYVVHVKAGIYKEEVLVSKQQPNVFMYGDGPGKTVVTGSKNFMGHVQTSKTAPFQVEGAAFFCKDMGFQNTAGPYGEQAVALRVNSLQSVFHNCWFDAYQDTLYVQGGSQFFRDCQISGTVDFIFGNAACLIQNSRILARKGKPKQTNLVTAQGGLAKNEATGIVIQGCQILPDSGLYPERLQRSNFLGRPWKAYAKTVFLENTIGDFIRPEGYMQWESPEGKNNHMTALYGEYGNKGPGANTASRVKWPGVKVLSKAEAERYAAGIFLGGAPWVKAAGVPLNPNVA